MARKILYEVSRSQMNADNKKGRNYVPWNQQKGKNRYERRVHSKLGTSVNQLNRIDMNKLFKEDTLDVNLEVHGETDDYIVRISFSGFLKELQKMVQPGEPVELKSITQALVKTFNNADLHIRCSCPDFIYRHAHWLTVAGAIAGEPEDRPNRFDRTNSHNDMGASCKHIAIALANTTWLVRTGNVIRNYIMYMEKHYPQLYGEVIYPAIYQQPYDFDEPVQQDLFSQGNGEFAPTQSPSKYDDHFNVDKDVMSPNDDIVDTANKWSRTRSQFKQGNEYRFRPMNNGVKGQRSFDFDSLAD